MNTPATRRAFVAGLAASAAATAQTTSGPKPNILWITCEDMGPHLHGCGDDYSVTPNLDGLMKRGLYYKNAWSNAPVCAPARTTIISGIYPTSNGSEHMRSQTRLAPGQKMYPQLLREAGYYCTNNSKTDYNLEEPGKVWDESSPRAHWRKRAPGQPFFAIFNFIITHESQLRTRPHEWKHDPAKVRVPAYHPDTPEVRQDWAQYYDNITTMDGMAGKVMDELRADGLEEDTIVFFYGDHGSGMPRNKRWPFNSGLNVSIVVHIPEKFKHLAPPEYKPGGTTDRLVGLVDLAPTLMGPTPRRRATSTTASADAWTNASTWCAPCATSATSTSATTCRTRSTANTSPICLKLPPRPCGTRCTTRASSTRRNASSGRRSPPKSSTIWKPTATR
jgi:arylsulfatase A-like enzyme